MTVNRIAQLNPRHYKILEFVLRGWTNVQISDHLNVSQTMISVVRNSPSFQHEVSLRRAKLEDLNNQNIANSDQDVSDAIREGAKAAVDLLLGSIHSPDENIAIRASTEILDRGGFPKVSKIESKTLSVVLNAEDLKTLRDTMDLDKG